MTMDVVLVGFVAAFIFAGFRSGFIWRLLGIVYIVIAAVAGAYFRYAVGAIASQFFPTIPPDYANLVGFAIAFPAILVGLHILEAALLRKVVPQHGLSRRMDQALGAVFGGIEAIMILSVAVVVVDAYFGTKSQLAADVPKGVLTDFTRAFNGSETVKLLRGTTVPLILAVLGPVLPKDVSTLLPDGLPNKLPFGTPKP
ncbi:MAG TPA: CvpA family protein [Candidatus Limnocylindrales bacterium]